MKKIPSSSSLLVYLNALEASEAALSADEDASEFAGAFREAISEWDSVFARERKGRREVTRANAVVKVCNARLDDSTMGFSRMVKAVDEKLMSKLFKEAPGKFVRRELRKQCQHTVGVIVPEVRKLGDNHSLRPLASQLEALANKCLESLNKRNEVKGSNQLIKNDILEWKEGINALRTTTYAELLKLSIEKNYSREWVESFFGAESEDESEGEQETIPVQPVTPT